MLEKTLAAFQNVIVPDGMTAELIIVDNGSTDRTAEIVRSSSHSNMKICYVSESRKGKSRAQNAALAIARGEVFLFTDDDVVPAEDWLEKMSRPLLEMRSEAVAGRIFLAESHRRDWFTPMHEVWLAFVREPLSDSPELIGASMGIHRSVFDKIDGFDEELGPGASGFGEETLLWRQMQKAGMRILPVLDTYVVHYPDQLRLLRSNWLATATRFGRSEAYLKHHWFHFNEPFPRLQLLWMRTKLVFRSFLRRTPHPESEGCPAWEMSYLVRIETLKCFIKEVRRPRNYEMHGLRKISRKQKS